VNLHCLEDNVGIRGYVLALLLTCASPRDLESIGNRKQLHSGGCLASTKRLPPASIVLSSPAQLATGGGEEFHCCQCRLEDHGRIRGYILALLLTCASPRDLEIVGARRQHHADLSVAACGAERTPAAAVVLHHAAAESICAAVQ